MRITAIRYFKINRAHCKPATVLEAEVNQGEWRRMVSVLDKTCEVMRHAKSRAYVKCRGVCYSLFHWNMEIFRTTIAGEEPKCHSLHYYCNHWFNCSIVCSAEKKAWRIFIYTLCRESLPTLARRIRLWISVWMRIWCKGVAQNPDKQLVYSPFLSHQLSFF